MTYLALLFSFFSGLWVATALVHWQSGNFDWRPAAVLAVVSAVAAWLKVLP